MYTNKNKEFIYMIVALDGVTGSGKSGICKRIAKNLGFTYIRTGSFYRAIAYKVLQNNINWQNKPAIKKLLTNTKIEYFYKNEHVTLLLDGTDISNFINSPEVSTYASKVATLPIVRDYVKVLQQQAASYNQNIIMEGRDIGSVIFPNADIKFYIDCEINERAKRRVEQYAKNGVTVDFEQIKQDILARDKEDMERKHSPLIRLPEAYYLDTTNLSMDACVDIVAKQIKIKQKNNS